MLIIAVIVRKDKKNQPLPSFASKKQGECRSLLIIAQVNVISPCFWRVVLSSIFIGKVIVWKGKKNETDVNMSGQRDTLFHAYF